LSKIDWILFGQKEWYDLETDLGSRPTTGLIALYFLITYTQFKDLTIYGFDFWKTPDWLCRPTRVEIERNTDVHSFDKDKEYFFKLIKPYSNITWVED